LRQLMNAIFPGGAPRTYDSAGRIPSVQPPRQSIYEQVC
jgi:hypothetical protein